MAIGSYRDCKAYEYLKSVFIRITTPPWTAARGEGGMSMDGHSTRNTDCPKKRAGGREF